MGNVIMSGIVPPLEKPVGGTPLSELAVGSTLKLNVNGTAKDFLVVHQGKPSTLYDDSCDGVWLLMKDLYENRAWYTKTNNSYADSTIHSYLNGTFLGLLDSDIQSMVKQVKIPYRPGSSYTSATVNSGANGLSTKVFLLSAYETCGSGTVVDGAKLDYFPNTDSADASRVALLNNSSADWWIRSPAPMGSGDKTYYAHYISYTGKLNLKQPNYTLGIRPALILPSDALLQADGTIIV